MNAVEKVAYLKGFVEGAKIADTEDKKKFVEALLDTLETIATTLDDHEEFHAQLNEYLEQLDDDLAAVEEDVDEILGLDEECDDDCCCCHDDDCDCEEFDDEGYIAATCPFCKKEFYYEPGSYKSDENLLCPHCGKPFKQIEISKEE